MQAESLWCFAGSAYAHWHDFSGSAPHSKSAMLRMPLTLGTFKTFFLVLECCGETLEGTKLNAFQLDSLLFGESNLVILG